MMVAKYAVIIIVSFILGSVNLSILISQGLGGDVRSHGSGNAGATNMARTYGLGAGLAAMAGDMLKTVAAMLLGCWMLGDWGLACAGAACMLGHCFPLLYRFRGGKGISAGGAIAFAIDWRVGLVVLGVFLLGAFLSKKVSLGSVLAALAITAASLLFGVSTPRLLLAIFAMTLAIWQHRENIKRLIAGTEPDFRAKGAKGPAKD